MTNERKQRILCCLTDDQGKYYYTGPIDGIWGPESQRAADRFLRDFTGETNSNDGDTPEKGTSATGTFWDHIRYWKREEFRCRCGGKYCNGYPVEPNQTLVELVDDIRHKAGRPGIPSSGLRCPTWNSLQGGVANSDHMVGKALDFSIEGMSGSQLLALAQADKRTRYAYIIDGGWVHVDVE